MPKKVSPKRAKKKTSTKHKRRSFFSTYRKSIIVSAVSIVLLGGFSLYHTVKSQAIPYVPLPDYRGARIDAYFKKYNMPLAGYGEQFVAVADTCDMDWRLLPAIAVRESSGGKRMQLNNPFGWGGAHIPFTDINHAIEVVGANLCGHNPKTARWYSTTSTQRKLYYYNGTVITTYPKEVQWIMEQF